MRGEQYYLFLIGKDGREYRVYNKPLTLEQIDKHTTKYENKRELIKTILDNTKVIMNPREIKDVKIKMKPNKDIESYKDEIGPFYKKDMMVTNEDAIEGKFELMCMNKEFVLSFVERYSKIPNFAPTVMSIKASIHNNREYMEELESLANKILKTYKGGRGVYYQMKNYNPKRKVKDSKFDSVELESKITENEKRTNELEYLKQYERELLDIEDFNHYENISPFDEHKITRK